MGSTPAMSSTEYLPATEYLLPSFDFSERAYSPDTDHEDVVMSSPDSTGVEYDCDATDLTPFEFDATDPTPEEPLEPEGAETFNEFLYRDEDVVQIHANWSALRDILAYPPAHAFQLYYVNNGDDPEQFDALPRFEPFVTLEHPITIQAYGVDVNHLIAFLRGVPSSMYTILAF